MRLRPPRTSDRTTPGVVGRSGAAASDVDASDVDASAADGSDWVEPDWVEPAGEAPDSTGRSAVAMSGVAVVEGPPAPANAAPALAAVVDAPGGAAAGAPEDERLGAAVGDAVVEGGAPGRVVPAEASTPRGPEHAVATTARASRDATVPRARPFAVGRRVTVGWSRWLVESGPSRTARLALLRRRGQ